MSYILRVLQESFLRKIYAEQTQLSLGGCKVGLQRLATCVKFSVCAFSSNIDALFLTFVNLFFDCLLRERKEDFDTARHTVFQAPYDPHERLAGIVTAILFEEQALLQMHPDAEHNLNLEEYNYHLKDFITTSALEMLVCGDVKESVAVSAFNKIMQRTANICSHADPHFVQHSLFLRECLVPQRAAGYFWQANNPHSKMATVIVVIQCGPRSAKNGAMTTLTKAIFSEWFFDELRTKEQLGYSVEMNTWCSKNQCRLTFQVETRHGAWKAEDRIERFIDVMPDRVQQMTRADFAKLKRTSTRDLLRPFTKLGELCSQFAYDIIDQSYIFTNRSRVANALGGLRKADLIKFLTENVVQSPRRRRLSVHLEPPGRKNSDAHTGPAFPERIDNLTEFKRSCLLDSMPTSYSRKDMLS